MVPADSVSIRSTNNQMKFLRSYVLLILPLIIVALPFFTVTSAHASGADITIAASVSSTNDVQLNGSIGSPLANTTYTWQWYSTDNGGTAALLTDNSGNAATGASINTTLDDDSVGTHTYSINVVATSTTNTSSGSPDVHTGSTTLTVTWDANGNATIGSAGSASTSNPATITPASSATCGSNSQICNPVGGGTVTDFTGLLVSLIKYMLGLIGIVAVAMIIYGGYQLAISSGNADRQKKGRQTIIYAIAGLLVAVLSYSGVSIVENAIKNQTGTSSTPSLQQATPSSTSAGTSTTTTGVTGASTGVNGVSATTPAPSTTAATINTNGGASASNANCTSSAIGYFSVVLASSNPVPVDATNGSAPAAVTYTPTPSNSASAVCSTLPFETFLIDDDAGTGTDEPKTPPSAGQIDSGQGFTENSFAIPASYSQDSNVDACVFYTSLSPVLTACAIIPIVETSGGVATSTATNCTAANIAGGVSVDGGDSVNVTDGDENSIEYTTTPNNPNFANCNLNFETYIFPGGGGSATSEPPSGEPDDSGNGFGTNTATIPSEAYSGESEITIGVYYTDSSGNVVLGGADSVAVNEITSDNTGSDSGGDATGSSGDGTGTSSDGGSSDSGD